MDILPSDIIMETFISELRTGFGSSLREVWLFSSRARGDEQDWSDYDVLVVAVGDVTDLKQKVREAELVCMELHNALVSGIVHTEAQWEDRKQTPLGWNIQREGKLVA